MLADRITVVARLDLLFLHFVRLHLANGQLFLLRPNWNHKTLLLLLFRMQDFSVLDGVANARYPKVKYSAEEKIFFWPYKKVIYVFSIPEWLQPYKIRIKLCSIHFTAMLSFSLVFDSILGLLIIFHYCFALYTLSWNLIRISYFSSSKIVAIVNEEVFNVEVRFSCFTSHNYSKT
jgi:hypothetical protein